VRTSSLEVADIFRAMGPSYRLAQAGRLSLAQLKVMSAIQNCRTAALGGHVDGCDDCGYLRVAYNSCRNRHCPKCPAAAARAWLAEREADLLPIGYFHVVFTLPAEVADIAWQNKAVVYDLLFRGPCQSNGRPSTFGVAHPDQGGRYAARSRHSANAPARLCLYAWRVTRWRS
jgi:Transposase zinc-binding domain